MNENEKTRSHSLSGEAVEITNVVRRNCVRPVYA